MKKLLYCAAAAALCCLLSVVALGSETKPAGEPTPKPAVDSGTESGPESVIPAPVVILNRTIERNYDDIELTVHLVKISKSGRERPMDLLVKIKDGPDVKRTYAEFIAPPEVKGMKSLSWDYKEEGVKSDRWFQLAGLDYVKCVGKACQSMEDRFGFSMDIFAVKLDEAEHKYLEPEKLGGTECYKIETRLKDEDEPDGARYVTWVDKEKFAARRIESYDKDGDLVQESNFTEFKMIGDHWWETKGELIKHNSGKTVKFEIKAFKVNEGIDDSVFEKPSLFKVKDN